MVAHEPVAARTPSTPDRRLPPVTELTVGSMAAIICGGIYLASYLPKTPSLVPPIILLVAGVLLLGAAVAALRRVGPFAWDSFALVGRWTLLAYVVIAGMLEYVFVVDGTRGGPLVVLTLSLIVYAVDIPLILAFSVARYQPVRG